MTENVIIESSVQEIADATISRLIAAGLITGKKQERTKRINWERLLAYEYVEKFYSEVPHWFRIEVGPMPRGETDLLYSKTRRWADCVLRMPDHMLVIEFKMKAEPAVVSQLMHYGQLIPETPLFKKYRGLPVKIKVVCAMIDDITHQFIESQGIDVEVYKPGNFEEWYKAVILKEKRT
jgi:hypothetical protein